MDVKVEIVAPQEQIVKMLNSDKVIKELQFALVEEKEYSKHLEEQLEEIKASHTSEVDNIKKVIRDTLYLSMDKSFILTYNVERVDPLLIEILEQPKH